MLSMLKQMKAIGRRPESKIRMKIMRGMPHAV